MSSRERARVAAATSTLINAGRASNGLDKATFNQVTAATLSELITGPEADALGEILAEDSGATAMRLGVLIGQLACAAACLLDQLALHDPAHAEAFVRQLAELGAGGE